MHGNVWEWCFDWWAGYEGAGIIDPAGPPDCWYRVMRGGSAWRGARDCRAANRFWGHPGGRDRYLGFRPAVSPLVSKEPLDGVES